MKWTKTPPTKPGRYWMRDSADDEGSVWCVVSGTPPSPPGREWSDEPLPECEEPEFVPTEVGWYWARHVDAPPNARTVVYVTQYGDTLEVRFKGGFWPLSTFTDWSERIVDPGPKGKP